jgi:hypothetical protein
MWLRRCSLAEYGAQQLQVGGVGADNRGGGGGKRERCNKQVDFSCFDEVITVPTGNTTHMAWLRKEYIS